MDPMLQAGYSAAVLTTLASNEDFIDDLVNNLDLKMPEAKALKKNSSI
jgi:hypothetical protein